MKRGHVIFNVVGLCTAGLFLVSALSTWFVVMLGVPLEKRGFWYFMFAMEAIMTLLIAGGGIANFAKGRLAGWPTGMMVFAYCISVWLLPLGVWGIVILLIEPKRRRIEAGQAAGGVVT